MSKVQTYYLYVPEDGEARMQPAGDIPGAWVRREDYMRLYDLVYAFAASLQYVEISAETVLEQI